LPSSLEAFQVLEPQYARSEHPTRHLRKWQLERLRLNYC
jgi:hypothetical protein